MDPLAKEKKRIEKMRASNQLPIESIEKKVANYGIQCHDSFETGSSILQLQMDKSRNLKSLRENVETELILS